MIFYKAKKIFHLYNFYILKDEKKNSKHLIIINYIL